MRASLSLSVRVYSPKQAKRKKCAKRKENQVRELKKRAREEEEKRDGWSVCFWAIFFHGKKKGWAVGSGVLNEGQHSSWMQAAETGALALG